MSTNTNAQKILNFINEIQAFEMMPEQYLKTTKNKLITNEWKVFRFDAKVKNDKGWEADQTLDGEIYATYCWTGLDEYCITSQDYFDKHVKSMYKKSVGKCVFSLDTN